MLIPAQAEWVLSRVPFFDEARCAVLFHDDQPDDGQYTVRGQGKFPAIMLRSGIVWFPVPNHRPVRKDGGTMKTKVPARSTALDWDTTDPDRLIVVEGQAELLALRSLGFEGVVCANGTQSMASSAADRKRQRRDLFAGKDVYVLFDADAAGDEAGAEVATNMLEAGATRVAVAKLPNRGQDLDEWLGAMHREGQSQDAMAGAVHRLLGEARLSETAEDVQHYHGQEAAPSQTAADRLVGLVDPATLWHTPDGTPYATVPVGEHTENLRLDSRAFRNLLARQHWEQQGKAPGSEHVRQALAVLGGVASFDGPEHAAHVRVARDGAALYIDLGRPDWGAARVTADGWSLVPSDQVPVKFRRPGGLAALPEPVSGGSLDCLREFLPAIDDDAWYRVAGWLVGAFRSEGPYFVLLLAGEAGSAKSFTGRVLRSMVDPHVLADRAEPQDLQDLALAAQNSWVLVLDNLSHLRPWLSDALCRVATGAGFATRQLYTNDEEALFSAARPIIMNGIANYAVRGDLIDRSLAVELPRIADEHRRTEKELYAALNAARPALFGALLTAVSTALANEDSLHLAAPGRMADAETWIAAAEPALPWSGPMFRQAYARNREEANAVVLESSPLVPLLELVLRAHSGSWAGRPADLLRSLTDAAHQENPGALRGRDWPGTPRAVAGALRRLAPNLRGNGWTVEVLSAQKARNPIRLALPDAEPKASAI